MARARRSPFIQRPSVGRDSVEVGKKGREVSQLLAIGLVEAYDLEVRISARIRQIDEMPVFPLRCALRRIMSKSRSVATGSNRVRIPLGSLPEFVSVRSLVGTPLFRQCLQHLASVLQVVSRQRVVRFETQRLFAGRGALVVLPQLVVSRPDIIPGFRVTWPQGERGARCRDRFRVTPFAITLEA